MWWHITDWNHMKNTGETSRCTWVQWWLVGWKGCHLPCGNCMELLSVLSATCEPDMIDMHMAPLPSLPPLGWVIGDLLSGSAEPQGAAFLQRRVFLGWCGMMSRGFGGFILRGEWADAASALHHVGLEAYGGILPKSKCRCTMQIHAMEMDTWYIVILKLVIIYCVRRWTMSWLRPSRTMHTALNPLSLCVWVFMYWKRVKATTVLHSASAPGARRYLRHISLGPSFGQKSTTFRCSLPHLWLQRVIFLSFTKSVQSCQWNDTRGVWCIVKCISMDWFKGKSKGNHRFSH